MTVLSMDHVARALAYPCEVCKAAPMRPCLESPMYPKPVFDGCHTSRVYRGLYSGRKMKSAFRKYDPEHAQEREVSSRTPEPRETLEELIERATASWESKHGRRKLATAEWHSDDRSE